jgi:putative NADH-flavin reductase
MKHVILIGASGFVGSAILEELLNRGHHVTAIVRTPNKLTQSHTNLKVEVMDVEDPRPSMPRTGCRDKRV